MINLRQIEAFRAVMAHKTVTRAAQTLHISQPAVSRLISDLEYYIGFNLFLRHKGRLTPTPEAQAFSEEVERSFIGLERITETARDIREFRTGRLFICAMPALSISLLPPIVHDFSQRHPGVSISLQAHSSQRVVQWVATQQCDVGFIGMSIEDPGVSRELLGQGALKLVMPADHPLTSKDSINAVDLTGEPFISVGQLLDVRPDVDRVFTDAGVERDMRLETQLSSVACEMVLTGAGISLIDPVTAHAYTRRGLVAHDFHPAIPFTYSALLPTFRPPSRLSVDFIDEVSRHLHDTLRAEQAILTNADSTSYNINE